MTLIQIRPAVVLRDVAAWSFLRLESQAGRQLDVNRTTEDYDVQLRAYRAYQAYSTGTGPWAPLALSPNLSRHVYREDDPTSGCAWDTDERGDWLAENGWIADVGGEPWHHEYRIQLDQHQGDTMAITNEDLIKFLGASFDSGTKKADGTPRWVNIADALRAVYFYGDKIYAQNIALTAAVTALAGASGADPARISQIIEDAVREAVGNIKIEYTAR